MAAVDVWVAKDDGTEIIRARDITAVSLDHHGDVVVRLASDAALVTLVRGRADQDEHRGWRFSSRTAPGRRPVV